MSLTDMEKKELRRFRDRVRQTLGDRDIEVKLFGSKARGDARSDSDLDVLIVASRDDWKVRKRICSLAMDALLDSGVLISPKTLSRGRFQRLKDQGSPFVLNVLSEGVSV